MFYSLALFVGWSLNQHLYCLPGNIFVYTANYQENAHCLQPIYYVFSKGLVRQTWMQGSILLLTSLLFHPTLCEFIRRFTLDKDLEMCHG